MRRWMTWRAGWRQVRPKSALTRALGRSMHCSCQVLSRHAHSHHCFAEKSVPSCMAKPHHNILQLTVAAALILFISFSDSLISGAHHHKTGSARHMLYGRQEA